MVYIVGCWVEKGANPLTLIEVITSSKVNLAVVYFDEEENWNTSRKHSCQIKKLSQHTMPAEEGGMINEHFSYMPAKLSAQQVQHQVG